jgi:uncharacterized membrane protein (DUF4010 family)
MDELHPFFRFGIALAIGVLIGMEREHSARQDDERRFAGVRTYPLFALLGATGALMADITSIWTFVALTILAVGLIIASYAVTAHEHIGLTTEVSAGLTYACGALCVWGEVELAVAVGVVTVGLLTLKLELHRFAERISREDIYATLKFAAISLIVLPVLPNQDYGPPPFDVLNPYKTWLMVVFISGISFLGFLMIKVVGARRGIGLTGLLGGLVSSTAVTLSFSERSEQEPNLVRPFALAVILAWTVMFVRVVVEVAALNAALLREVWPPMAAAGAVGLVACVVFYLSQRSMGPSDVQFSNPFELGTAIKFGLFYALVLVVANAAEFYFQDTGLYVASVLAGLTDVDAITLSMAQLAGAPDGVSLATGARAVVLAVMSNTLVKGGIAMVVGSTALRRTLVLPFFLVLATGITAAMLVV